MTRRIARFLAAAAATVWLTGCELVGIECTTDFRPALIVEAVDSLSGMRLDEPLMWVRDGAFVDTLDVFDGMGHGAGERPGTYEVHVEHVGYTTWSRTGIRVTEDECHVRTRELTARLQSSG